METNSIDATLYREAIGRFATGIAIVTTIDGEGRPQGMTVNSLTSVSLNPPSLLWSLGDDAVNQGVFEAAHAFAVNILGVGQDDLSNHFAAADASPSWDGIPWFSGEFGLPLLNGALAFLECRLATRVRFFDHQILLGQVQACKTFEKKGPLLYFEGKYREL